MKRLIIILLVFITTKTFATTYYFSNSGNDNNNGTSASTPFKTLTKLNSLPLVAGDSVLFKCGDTFRGQINITRSGSSISKIVFASFGSGNKPVISGAETVTNWTLNGTKYQATFHLKPNNFFVENKEQVIARYPNVNQYLTLDSAQKYYLKDASLSSLPSNYFTNSSVCVHTAQWCWEKSSISSFTNSNKLTYTSPMHLAAINNYGYFIYDNVNLLDTANEWKYDSTNAVLYYQPQTGLNPNNLNCEASVYLNGIVFSNSASFINIENLQFEKQENCGVLINNNCSNITITNCDFENQYNYGCNDKGLSNLITNCTFTDIDGISFLISDGGKKSTLSFCNFKRTGLVRNNGIGQEINGSAVKSAFADSNYIHHNVIDSTGYCGISVDGTYNVVEKNIIKNVMLCNNDGAALKSFGGQSHHNTFQNNFIESGDGNKDGTYQANFVTPAIYFDFNVNNSILKNNTVYNRTQKGIFQNAGDSSNTIEANTIYGANIGIDLNATNLQPTVIKNMSIKKNVFWAKNKADYIFRQVDTSGFYNYGNIDSNYYFQPYNSKDSIIYRLNGLQLKPYSFTNWQGAGFDLHTKINDFRWQANIDSSKLFINPTDSSALQDLQGYVWKDLDGNLITSLTLQPWTSKVLIKTTTALPIEFGLYEVKRISDKQALNSWMTTTEINANVFNIQKSTDGKTYTEIGQVAAYGKASSYSFTDNNANKSIDNYYRIEAVDKDGKLSYSEVKKVAKENQQFSISLYPNPANNVINISINQQAVASVYSISGKEVITKTLTEGINQIQVQTLSAGFYIVSIKYNNQQTSIKFIKQ